MHEFPTLYDPILKVVPTHFNQPKPPHIHKHRNLSGSGSTSLNSSQNLNRTKTLEYDEQKYQWSEKSVSTERMESVEDGIPLSMRTDDCPETDDDTYYIDKDVRDLADFLDTWEEQHHEYSERTIESITTELGVVEQLEEVSIKMDEVYAELEDEVRDDSPVGEVDEPVEEVGEVGEVGEEEVKEDVIDVEAQGEDEVKEDEVKV